MAGNRRGFLEQKNCKITYPDTNNEVTMSKYYYYFGPALPDQSREDAFSYAVFFRTSAQVKLGIRDRTKENRY